MYSAHLHIAINILNTSDTRRGFPDGFRPSGGTSHGMVAYPFLCTLISFLHVCLKIIARGFSYVPIIRSWVEFPILSSALCIRQPLVITLYT